MTTTPLSPEARAAFGVFVLSPRRPYAADLLIARIIPMQAHAAARAANTPAWRDVEQQLTGAIVAADTAVDTPLLLGRPVRRAAVRIVLDAIVAYESAEALDLPDNEDAPEPGTEFPFSISDIAHAAVQLLGPDWRAKPRPRGIAATIENIADGPGAHFDLAADEDGVLYVFANLRDESRTDVDGVPACDDLDELAERVADTVSSLRDAD